MEWVGVEFEWYAEGQNYVADRDRLLRRVAVSRARRTDQVEAAEGRNGRAVKARALRLRGGESHGTSSGTGSGSERYGSRKPDYSIESCPSPRLPTPLHTGIRQHQIVNFKLHRSYNRRLPSDAARQ